ncbi:guanine nucleotide exchange factor subunit Rich [Trichogramma pretiosum]|uniref:guanine nucleotide exchange factor subunit Rich n=1 Tax=Trichogramma pretiosum TaxID=7493 RepID=UPI0006C9B6D6|nr:guanine nucleotide exchange factor subunit Rich [Trichogramma pretiosum]
MYFPVGWPRVLNIPEVNKICSIICNRDKILFGVLFTDAIGIWCCDPCIPLVYQRRTKDCLDKYGQNVTFEWRPDSSMLVVATAESYLLFYHLVEDNASLCYEQINSVKQSKKCAEFIIKDSIPSISIKFDTSVWIDGGISALVCIRDELMIATKSSFVIRHKWSGGQNRDYTLDLRRIPFSVDQQMSTAAVPLTSANVYITCLDYSPLAGGFAIVLNNGKAAFLTALSLKFDPNQVQGVWVKDVDDVTCTAVNHKYKLMAFGRKNGQGIVLYIDETSGALELSHNLILSTKDYPGVTGAVSSLRWTPDSCAVAMAWSSGGIALWSTFGALLLCTLKWDYGVSDDPLRGNHFYVTSMEWSAEGYQLWMLQENLLLKRKKIEEEKSSGNCSSVMQWNFVKSPLTVNPCLSPNGHIYLQGEDRLYINLGHKMFSSHPKHFYSSEERLDGFHHVLTGRKQWLVIPIPKAYTRCNWPVRFTAIDEGGKSIAIAGKTGLAHYSIISRKWKLFGNEYQERDFVVTGGLLWYRSYLITSCYSIQDDEDEIRLYSKDFRLDNSYVRSIKLSSQILLMNLLKNLLLTFCASSQIRIYNIVPRKVKGDSWIELVLIQTVDISALCSHPACVVSANLSLVRTEAVERSSPPETLLLNISGKLLMIQRDYWTKNSNASFACAVPLVLASSVENVWIPSESRRSKQHLTEAVWLFCGAHGIRVWLPLFSKHQHDKSHSFISKRIMLPFHLKIHPLTILFEDAILLGAENDTLMYTSNIIDSPFVLPYCVLQLTSQVYLHQILRQLIHRNLGFHAWEIARSCSGLPYFSHSLELLLHEVLEEEATSKEPLPDAQLPPVVEFIKEFPNLWARAVVQCARKTEIALWPYLFAVVGTPKQLLQTCLNRKELDTAASYLLILQSLEASFVSKQYATLLLDASLEDAKWELSRDLIRFLRAIDPNDVNSDSHKSSSNALSCRRIIANPTLSSQDDLTLVLGTMQISRNRSSSTSTTPEIHSQSMTRSANEPSSSPQNDDKSGSKRKKSVPILSNIREQDATLRASSSTSNNNNSNNNNDSAEDFFIDVMLKRHARRLLTTQRILDLGSFAAHLDFHLVIWLARERDRAARVDDYVAALKAVHAQFSYPYPVLKLLESNSNVIESSSHLCDIPEYEDDQNHDDSESLHFDSGYISSSKGGSKFLRKSYALRTSGSVTDASPDMSSFIEGSSDMNDNASVTSNTSTLDTILWIPTSSSATVSELLVTEAAASSHNAGSGNDCVVSRSEVRLRYLLQLFLEAGCLGWAAIVAVVLRDASAVARTVRAAHATAQTLDLTINLRDGLLKLLKWSHSECLGYRRFLVELQGQIALLQRCCVDKQKINNSSFQDVTEEEADDFTVETQNLVPSLSFDAEMKNLSSSYGPEATVPRAFIENEPQQQHQPQLQQRSHSVEYLQSDNQRTSCLIS